MILCDAQKRLILWGCEIQDQIISAELVYVSSYFTPDSVELKTFSINSSKVKKEKYRVKIPKNLRDRDFDSCATNVFFHLVN